MGHTVPVPRNRWETRMQESCEPWNPGQSGLGYPPIYLSIYLYSMVVSPFQEGDPDESAQKDKRTKLQKRTTNKMLKIISLFEKKR